MTMRTHGAATALGVGWMFASLLLAAVGCGPEITTNPPDPVPRIQKLEDTSYAVGETFSVRGRNFAVDKGTTELHFEGEFRARDGSTSPVDVRVPVVVKRAESDDGSERSDAENGGDGENNREQIATWLRFGPFTNPFVQEGKVGTFEGTITPVNEFQEEGSTRTVRGVEHRTDVEVEPSIEFVALQPKGADCGAPALRGFPGPDYRIEVRAVGFVPKTFEWRISSIADGESIRETRTFSHRATGPTDTLGDEPGETIDFEPVPQGTKYYVAGIQVRAKDRATGKYVHSSLPFGIHRPIEVREAGPFEVAQHYRPEPVTACIPGAVGNTATYSETETEVRQRTVSVGVSRSFSKSEMRSRTVNWQKGYQVTNTRSQTRTRSRSRTRTETTARTQTDEYNKSSSNSFTYGTEKGQTWRVGNEVGAEVTGSGQLSLPLVAEGQVEVTGRYNRSWGKSTSRREQREWGRTVTRGESHSFSKSYTLSDSVSSSYSYSDTKSRSESRTYDFGAAATRSQRISQGITKSEKETWMRSESSSTLTEYSAYIPPDQFGVFYRQTIRMIRRAEVVAFNACGESRHMGVMRLNTWNWAPDLATGDSCGEELPEPNLPPAECHIEPCD